MKKTMKSKFKNIIGPRVKDARFTFDPVLSQNALSGRLAKQDISLDRSAISRIESRERYVINHEAIALVKYLKVSVGYLSGEK